MAGKLDLRRWVLAQSIPNMSESPVLGRDNAERPRQNGFSARAVRLPVDHPVFTVASLGLDRSMPGNGYILRQAQFLLRFADSVSNPEMRAKPGRVLIIPIL